MLDHLARRASEELHEAQEAAQFTVGMPRRGRHGLVRLVVVGAVAIAVIVGMQLLVDGDPEEQGFVGPPEEPSREADVILYFTHDFDQTLGEIAAADIAAWDGVEFAAFWDADRAMDVFLARYAQDLFIVERAHQNPASFPASVRIWVATPDDRWTVLEWVDDQFPNALGASLGDMDPPYEYVVVIAGVVYLGPTGVHPPTPDNPWGIDLEGLSEYESSVLGDMELTFDEYRAAAEELVDCVRGRGVLITDPVYSVEAYQFDFSIGPYVTLEDSDAAARVYDACNVEYLDDITTAWVGQTVTPEIGQAARDEIAACLRSQGLEISDHPTHAEVVWVVEQAGEVSEEAGVTALDCMSMTTY